MNRVTRITAALAVFILAHPVSGIADPVKADSQGSGQRVWQLPATGKWYEGQRFYRSETPLDRSTSLDGRSVTLYMADLEPGMDYTLGLRYRADAGYGLSVELFDRWPFEPEVRRFKLPTGPVVRTDPQWIEYRWRLGVSPRSRGNTAFFGIQSASNAAARAGRFPHFVYLVTPAVRPMNHIGSGITYLRGPSDLMLFESMAPAQYVVVSPILERYPPDDRRGDRVSGKSLIYNGDFRHGFDGWEMFSDTRDGARNHLALDNDGLRIGSGNEPVRSGVRQTVQRDVGGSRSLALEAVLRIEEDMMLHPRIEDAVELSVCYLDVQGRDHCGDDSYRASFTTLRLPPGGGSQVRIAEGTWFTFEDELMDLEPRPQVIKSVALAGGHNRGQVAWIRQVNLTERGSMR